MQRAKTNNTKIRQALALATVAACGLDAASFADVSGGSGSLYTLPTTGATALAAFTTAQNNRGPYLLGQASLVLGASTYTLDTVNGQAFGSQLEATPTTPPEPPTTADRLVYQYHSTGSANGIREVARAQGLLAVSAFPVSSTNQLFVMGQPISALNGGLLANGYGATVSESYNPVIAYSDVRADQAFRVAGTPAFHAIPTAPGYGQGRPGIVPGVSFQRLTDVSGLDDPTDAFAAGVETLNNRVRNESLAVVPFTISASPGTGLDSLAEEDVAFLQSAGRLKNGANFNFVTRDIGSGTRNQGALNFGIDPSWAAGERDRLALAETSATDIDGNLVTIAVGDEQSPERGIRGESTVSQNEHRPSAVIRFSDKTSGGSGIRPVLLRTRMSLGILSAGDVGTRGTAVGTAEPLRVLAIDFNEDNSLGGEPTAGPVQPNFADVTEGRYQMWSASQAVTISPDGSTIAETTALKGDINDGTDTGVGRKFLDNILGSIASGPNPTTPATPFDSVVLAGFIPKQVMAVDKARDGAVQFSDPRSTIEDPVTGFSEQEIWEAIDASKVPYVPAGEHDGNIAGQLYQIYDAGTGTTSSTAAGDVQITFTPRIYLAGDLNGDQVRDLADVPDLARAYADTTGYLAANPTVTTGAETATTGNLDTSALTSEQHYGLLVLTDLNGDGNVQVVDDFGFDEGSNAKDKVVPVSRQDVKFFLYGAAVDTTSANPALGYEGSTDPKTRRELGVRLGQLKKNAAIDTFNSTLDTYVGTVNNPQTGEFYTQVEIDALKFNKFDVNGDLLVDREDARIVDRNIGKDYTSLEDVLGTTDDLIAAELNDNNFITHIDPDEAGPLTSDFQLIRGELGGMLLDGDADINGIVDVADLGILASNWQTSVDRWSLADFDFNGLVDVADLGLLASNWQQTATGLSLGEALAAVGLGGVAVPEPACVGVLTFAAVLGLRRRRVV